MNHHCIDPKILSAIQLVNAIKQLDDEAVGHVLSSIASPEFGSQTVRVNTTFIVDINTKTEFTKQALLWAAPVVIRRNAHVLLAAAQGDVSLKNLVLSRALQEAIHPANELRYLPALLSYETISNLTPARTFSALKAMAGIPPATTFEFAITKVDKAHKLPQLGFIIGSALAINRFPAIPTLDSIHKEYVRSLIAGMLSFKQGAISVQPLANITALEPMPFERAIERGIHTWLDVLASEHTFHQVSLKPCRLNKYLFELHLQYADDEVEMLTWTMQTTQVSEQVIANIYDRIDAMCSMPSELRIERDKLLH